MDKVECVKHKVFDFEWEECYTVKDADEGTIWGWLSCAMASNAFLYGCDYDCYKDKCTCKEPAVPIIWRR